MEFTLITAIFNRAVTIGQVLDNVARQSYDAMEHLIIDGASTDGTFERIRDHAHPQMPLVREHYKGIYNALNKGIAAATGDPD